MGEAEAPDDSEETQESGSGKSTVRVERPLPRRTLEHAIRVAQVIRDNNGGNPWAKDQIAESLSINAGSSNFTYLACRRSRLRSDPSRRAALRAEPEPEPEPAALSVETTHPTD